MKRPALEIEDLTVALPAHADRAFAVEHVSLSVGRQEIVCLVGESGSGKSVVAHSIMGLLPKALKVTSGRILLDGEDLRQATAERRRDLRCTRMSMIFQEPMTALNPVLTCGDQIDEVLRTHTRMPSAERRARILDVMRQVRLPEPDRLIDTYPHQLSGGQRQRIMIAMALVLEPALLIADEPTTALDVTTQAQILELIRDIQRSHDTGVLFITHDFGVVAEIAHRVAVMQRGRLVELGETRQVLSDPQHPYTRMLIGSVPTLVPRIRPRRASAPTVLQIRELAKTYRDKGFFRKARVVNAAEQVSLEIRRGEALGLVGESGSGKSTVARCVARLIDPSDGEILLEGRDIARMPTGALRQHRRHVQIVFQDPYRSLNPRRSVGASIVEGPMNYGTSRDKAWSRARELMALVGLDPAVVDRYPHEFSGGQRQRICIARALAMEPRLLIADEAVSALDVSVQAQVLALIDDIRARLDLALLFITHDLRVAAQVCDTIAVMSNGRVVEYGSAAEIYASPRHEYTKALFAAAPGKDWEFARPAA